LKGTHGQGVQVYIDVSEVHAGDDRVGEPALPCCGAVLPPPRYRVYGEQARAGDLARNYPGAVVLERAPGTGLYPDLPLVGASSWLVTLLPDNPIYAGTESVGIFRRALQVPSEATACICASREVVRGIYEVRKGDREFDGDFTELVEFVVRQG